MVETMLGEAIRRSGIPPKAIAAETNYSVDAIYAACQGKRKIPRDATRKLSSVNMLAGMAVALQETGYRVFEFFSGDRHPQTMLRRVEKEDSEADEALKGIGWRTIDKDSPEDLTEDDRTALKIAAKEVADRIKTDFNLLVEWDDRYQLGILDYLIGKNKKALGSAQGTYKTI